MAFKLQESKVKQRIADASKTVEVIERMKLIEVATQEVSRRRAELEATILRPAEAEKFKTQVMAAANHKKTILEAEGAAMAIDMKVPASYADCPCLTHDFLIHISVSRAKLKHWRC